MAIMDSEDKLQELCATLGVSPQVSSPSDLAFSVPDADSLEVLIRHGLTRRSSPGRGTLQNPHISDEALKIHKEAGKLRRRHAEANSIPELSLPSSVTTRNGPAGRTSGATHTHS